MKRVLILTPAALLLFAIASGHAEKQQKTLKDQIVGTWIYQSVDIVRPDGSRVPLFGPNPSGIARFEKNGRYFLLTVRRGINPFTSRSRESGTAEENKAVVQGSIAHFGKYTVNESDKTVIFQIETSTFPNWNGVTQTRPIAITSDELKWTTAASSGGTAEVTLKRDK